jgi:hypothetical protein
MPFRRVSLIGRNINELFKDESTEFVDRQQRFDPSNPTR